MDNIISMESSERLDCIFAAILPDILPDVRL